MAAMTEAEMLAALALVSDSDDDDDYFSTFTCTTLMYVYMSYRVPSTLSTPVLKYNPH